MKSIKRILATVMAMAMMFALVTINASAEVTYDVLINEVRIEKDTTISLDKGTAYYDSANRILTLTNAEIAAKNNYNVIKFDSNLGDLTIKIVGNCKITATNAGIYGFSGTDLKIVGDGATESSLVITTTDRDWGDAIHCDTANISIDKVKLSVESGSESIIASGKITITNSDVTCTSNYSSALFATKGVEIENSKINFTSEKGYGIDCYPVNMSDVGNIIIKDCEGTIDSFAEALWSMSGSISFEGKDVLEMTSGFGSCVCGVKGITFDLADGSKIHAKSTMNAISTDTGSAITIKSGDILLPTDGHISTDKTSIQTASDDSASEVIIGFLTEYDIAEVDKTATWTKGGKTGAVLTSAADLDKLVSVSVDGTVIKAENYDTASGSTIVTFKTAYLDTLSVGKHTVVIKSNDGSATGYLVIKEAAKTEEPTTKTTTKTTTVTEEKEKVADTADNSAIGAFVALGAFAAVGYVSLKKRED